MADRVRLVDIAKRLHVTKVTVSKALRDHPDISDETRERVRKMAKAMGYSPNLLARSLSSKRSYTLGVVVPKIAHAFFSSVIGAIQERATTAGYGIVLAVSNEDAALERQHIQRLMAMRVDGLLVSVSQETQDRSIFERVRQMGIPLVFFDRRLEGLALSSVTVDDWGGAFQAVTYAVNHGYRRIAHIAGTVEAAIARERRAGYEGALRKHGLPVSDSWIIPGGFDEAHGYRAFIKLLEQNERPDAVLAVTYPVGLGAWAALREHARERIDQIQMIAFGEGSASDIHPYPLVYVRQPADEMGAVAVELLLEEIEADERPPPRHRVLQTVVQAPENNPYYTPDEARPPRT